MRRVTPVRIPFMSRPLIVLALAAVAALPAVAFADPPNVQIDHAWSRATPAGSTGVVYLTITEHGPTDTLTTVSSPVAANAQLHESVDDHGVMKMRPVVGLSIASGKPVTFAPGGYHIMLMGVKQALVAGTTFPVTLTFAKAGEVTATVSVQKVTATMPTMDHGGMGPMPGMPGH
jgi:periplasmic copper chaperone A